MEHSYLEQNETSGTSLKKNETLSQNHLGKPAWERRALLILLVLTAVAYIWGLDQSGWSNSFYSAAVQAGTKSWKAFFFGSIDASNFITVDKPPASLWVMALSARLFGLNSWSLLVPEALEGVACVWILYITVRRWFSPGAALLAGAVLAITPVAALMFRFNNPDALLVLVLTASAYAFTRALEEGKTKWLFWSSVLIGLGFLTKMLAAFFVIPAFVLVYLIFAPVSVRRRIVQIIISAVTVVVSAGWWVAIVQLMPAADRPYIGSSQDNSILSLIFGYNGLGRLTGNENGSGGGGGGGHFSGGTGLTRLFNSEMGGQISWLIPAALVLFVSAVWLLRRNWKSERAIPALILWAATFFITGLVFSFGSGTIHSYYTIALAPSIGAMIGISVDVLWKRREEWTPRICLAIATAATAVWSFVLLERSSTWFPWLRVAILIIGVIAALALAFGPGLGRNLFKAAAIASLAAVLAGPLAYTLQTISTPHIGSMPSAGPTVSNSGFGGNFGGGQGMSRFGSANSTSGQFRMQRFEGAAQSGFGNFKQSGNFGGFGGGAETSANTALVSLLKTNASKYTWAAATVGSQTSATYQLASDLPIMDIGGFTGSDPTPTLAQFKNYVSEGKVRYFISGGMGARGGFSRMGVMNRNTNGNSNGGTPSWSRNTNGNAPSWSQSSSGNAPSWSRTTNGEAPSGNFQRGGMVGGFGSNSAITTWVQNTFKSKTVGGVTVYDLTQKK